MESDFSGDNSFHDVITTLQGFTAWGERGWGGGGMMVSPILVATLVLEHPLCKSTRHQSPGTIQLHQHRSTRHRATKHRSTRHWATYHRSISHWATWHQNQEPVNQSLNTRHQTLVTSHQSSRNRSSRGDYQAPVTDHSITGHQSWGNQAPINQSPGTR